MNVPASITDGFLCSRGELPADLFNDIVLRRKLKLRTNAGREIMLDRCQSNNVFDDVRQSVAVITSLETSLADVSILPYSGHREQKLMQL